MGAFDNMSNEEQDLIERSGWTPSMMRCSRPKSKTIKWSSSWPKKEGYYWFYGFPYGKSTDKKPELSVVQVWNCGDGSLAYVRNANFWYRAEGGVGKFLPMSVPELPKI